MKYFLLCYALQYTLPLNIQIIDNRTNITPTLLMNPQPFLFNLCYPIYQSIGTKTRFKGCTITAIKLPILFHLVVPFLSTTVCTVVKSRYRTGGIEIPLGIFKGAALKCTFRHFLHEKWCAHAA